MNVKKIGRAKINLKDELWEAEGRKERFHMNLRLVSSRPEVKAARAAYSKLAGKGRPPLRKPNKRADFLKSVAEKKQDVEVILESAYDDVLDESKLTPILLWKDKDYGRKMDWRFCIYKGVIYEFDRQGYAEETMLAQIEALEAKRANSASAN